MINEVDIRDWIAPYSGKKSHRRQDATGNVTSSEGKMQNVKAAEFSVMLAFALRFWFTPVLLGTALMNGANSCCLSPRWPHHR
jgi:hypothetical protein